MRRFFRLLGPFLALLPSPLQAAPTRVEIVFVLDTTGSMSGMIDEAKRKTWSIVHAVAAAGPAVRLGLLAFRDRGDAYVTLFVPPADDIDAVYARLMGLDAAGGGDNPESVNQALHEALSRVDWSEDPATLRAIFLVGDSPPHMDYRGDVPYERSCAAAAARGIRISTIQCGTDPATREVWQAIAACAGGDYFAIAAPGSSAPITTPFDAQLALHGRLLERTVVPYGTEEQQAAHRRRLETSRAIEAEAPDEARSERALFKADAERLVESGDLVDDVQRGATDLAALPAERLPEALRRIPEDQRQRHLDDLAERRRGLRSEIEWLAAERERYIETHYGSQEAALDRRVVRSLLVSPRAGNE